MKRNLAQYSHFVGANGFFTSSYNIFLKEMLILNTWDIKFYNKTFIMIILTPENVRFFVIGVKIQIPICEIAQPFFSKSFLLNVFFI